MPFAQEKMGFSRPPKLFLRQDDQNAANPLGKTGFYDPEKESITLYTTGRHPKDIMRSLAHELQHHTQKCNGEFENTQNMGEEGYAQSDPHMRTMEIQAYQASIVFRDWEDSCKGTIYYEHLQKGDNVSMSTKNWKNQELKSLLSEAWGFKMDLSKLNEELGDGEIDKDDDEKAGIKGADPENVGRGDVAAEAGVRGEDKDEDKSKEETLEEYATEKSNPAPAAPKKKCGDGEKPDGKGGCVPASPTDQGREMGQDPFEESLKLKEMGCGDHSHGAEEHQDSGIEGDMMVATSDESGIEALASKAMAAIQDLVDAAGGQMSTTVSTGDDTIVDEPQIAVSEARAQVLKLKALKEAIKKLSKGN